MKIIREDNTYSLPPEFDISKGRILFIDEEGAIIMQKHKVDDNTRGEYNKLRPNSIPFILDAYMFEDYVNMLNKGYDGITRIGPDF